MVLKRRNHVERMLVHIRYDTAVYCIKARTCFHMIVISLNFFFYFCFLFVFIVIFCHLRDNTIIMIKMLMETLYIFHEYRKSTRKPPWCRG